MVLPGNFDVVCCTPGLLTQRVEPEPGDARRGCDQSDLPLIDLYGRRLD